MQLPVPGPKVYRVKTPRRRFAWLLAPSGDFLTSDGETLSVQAEVGDEAVWDQTPGGYRHVVTGRMLRAERLGAGGFRLSQDDRPLGAQGAPGDPATFRAELGPARLPSRHLEEMRRKGWTALPAILPADVLDGLQRLGGVDGYEGAAPVEPDRQLSADPALARAACEPLSLWLCRRYMRLADIKLGHPPTVGALTPDDGERPVQGWHGDFPYMWGSERTPEAARIPPGRDEIVLGVQRNVCVSDFRLENGATVFALKSFKARDLPPVEWGRANRTWRAGDRQANGLPYGGEAADVVEAPAGSILLYDARIWHRAGVNRSNRRRGMVLMAVTPGFVIPFMPMTGAYKRWLASDAPQNMTERERREMEAIFVHRIRGPRGMFAVGEDGELTARVRA